MKTSLKSNQANIFFLFALSFFTSCKSSEVLQNDLCLEDDKYIRCNTEKAFSGTVITTFDNKQIATKTQFKDGIPDGSWTAYGYQGEIVQTGTYKPIKIENNFFVGCNISRVNLCTTNENGNIFFDAFIIKAPGSNCSSSGMNDYKKQIAVFLKNKKIMSNNDTLNKVRITTGELSE